jgi:hypothetical protein
MSLLIRQYSRSARRGWLEQGTCGGDNMHA